MSQAGTPAIRWLRTNRGLTNTSVTAFAAHLKPEAGIISSDPTAIRGANTAFTQELKVGASLIVGEQSQKITAIYSNDSLRIESAIDPLADQTSFEYAGSGTGSIASKDTIVTGSDTTFKQELKVGVTLIVGTQKRKITQIDSDTSLVVETAFNSNLPPGTPFSYRGAGSGTIALDRTTIRGAHTEFTKALRSGQAVSIDSQTYQIQRIISEDLLFLDSNISASQASLSSNTLFVGTAGGGVFRSSNNGATWEAINQGLTTLAIQAIAVRSAQTETEQDGYQLFAGTAIGVFQTAPVAQVDDKIEWQQVNGNLAYSDVRSLLPAEITLHSRSGILLAGTINGGVLLLVEAEQSTWLQTGLAGVDVQTLMLAPNGDIFAGTIADRVFRGVVSDRGITWQPLEAGLADSPNVTSLMSYQKPGIGSVTTVGTTVLGDSSAATSPTFTTELAIGDMLTIGDETRRVRRVFSDSRLELESGFSRDSAAIEFQVTRVFAGTPGSGIFRLKPDAEQRPIWEPVANNPADLNVLCLTVDPVRKTLFAGTASGGIFQSIDDGNLWTPLNAGLTSLDPQINPAAKVNTEFRAIAFVNQMLFAAGIGTLISPDTLYTLPLRAGDRLQVMASPAPLPAKGRETEEPIAEQKWTLCDRDGFTGVVFTATPTDVLLQPALPEDAPVSEQNAIALPPQDQQEPLLTLSDPTQNSYDPQTVQIYANVVAATQGETIAEILAVATVH
jgi:hypothetical protein